MQALFLAVVLAIAPCILGNCFNEDFPVYANFTVKSYVDFLHWHTGSDGEPAWKGTFHIELSNTTECRYIGIWPECNAPFLGFYDPSARRLAGGWAMFEHGWFGTIDYTWNGNVLSGNWGGYPNIMGFDVNEPTYAKYSFDETF